MRDPGIQDLSVRAADGVHLRVRHRPGARPPAFLLVHGMGSTAREWDEVADRLAARGHPTYAVDLRGHGESDAPAEGNDTATAAADVAAVAAALGLSGAVVAGHSWGASVSLRLAARHPALAAGLALVDGGWLELKSAHRSLTQYRDVLARLLVDRGFTDADAMRAHLRHMHPGWSERAIEAQVADMRAGPDGSLVPRLSRHQLASILESVWEDDPRRWLSTVTVPVMLLPATRPETPGGARQWRQWVAGAAAALSRPTIRWYENADHHVHCEQPDRLANDLLDLAREVEQ
ncbi:alpha/beta fold hydrolase [Spirillospora sp. NPDC048911]|uniref:alpha/beta fold hydrolase n=1 Tax=Spirillospora sp. NPDC048911 TaxID=3364527 RepID=UPI00371D18AC